MNKQSALASLGLAGDADAATVARAYGERLTAVQERLVSAQTDAEREEQRAKLSELTQAYEMVTGTGRFTKARVEDAGATVMRSEAEAPPPPNETFVRMEPGAVLSSRLEIGALLGQGGMGNVYAARDRLKNEDVAIKVLRQDLLFSTAAKERFLAEAKVSCSLSHPNIVRVHDVGMSGNYYYFSMERLKGHTLRQRMEAYRRESREFGVGEVSDIARQLIDALRYAHRYIVHRDLKPENIWLAEDGTVKLMDFGIARAFSNSQLTQTGMALGTAYYMAPEQRIAAKEVDWKADQYALGVVLYELLAGTLPTGAVRSLEKLRRDVPKRYADALMRAMAPKPEERFPSLAELLTEIEAPPRQRFGALRVAMMGVGLAAAVAGAFVVITNRGSESVPPETATASAQTAPDNPGSSSTSEAAGGSQSTAAPAAAAPGSPLSAPESSAAAPTSSDGTTGSSAANVEVAQVAQSGGTPPSPPPSGAGKAGAATVPTSDADASGAQLAVQSSSVARPEPPPRRLAKATPESNIDSRRQQCIAQCERDDGECRSLNRRGRQDCMRAVAFGSSGRLTTTKPAAADCAFFGQARCDHAPNREACLARMANRYKDCVNVLGGSIASRRQDCEEKARDADKMCLDELQECRASCN